jgi:D-tyrosyl-tRNA(Tyr) deacylase
MRLVIQRVSEASVRVDGELVAAVGRGLLVLVGVAASDVAEGVAACEPRSRWLTDKLLGLRIFPDEHKPMNRSLEDVGGELLLVSQFTLAANLDRGRRPGFDTAAPPEAARAAFDGFVALCRERWPRVQTGRFGADMAVALVNDGPVTFVLER